MIDAGMIIPAAADGFGVRGGLRYGHFGIPLAVLVNDEVFRFSLAFYFHAGNFCCIIIEHLSCLGQGGLKD